MTIHPIVVCVTKTCPNYRTKINDVIFESNSTLDVLLDEWGTGVESDEDYCPICGELGEIKDAGP